MLHRFRFVSVSCVQRLPARRGSFAVEGVRGRRCFPFTAPPEQLSAWNKSNNPIAKRPVLNSTTGPLFLSWSFGYRASMSKKRERAKTEPNDGGENGTTEDRGAESLLFEIASPSDDSSQKPSSKRSKSSNDISSASPPQEPKDEIAATGAAVRAEADSATSKYHPAAIAPSTALRQCDGFDVVRKGGRGRGRQLMVLPGALGLGYGGSGGKLGTLSNATSASPVLYVEFPEGRLKCTGRTVHTKGRFFTLYADKAAGRATRMDCRDVFDSVVFFGRASWVGTKEDNPSEEPLPLPESLQSLKEEEEAGSGGDGGDDDGSGSKSGGGGTKKSSTAADFKTHFGGGTPGTLMSGDSKNKTPVHDVGGDGSTGEGGVVAEEKGQGDGGGSRGEEEGEDAKVPARRVSSRSTKSTKTYVDDSDEELDDEDGSSSSGSDEGEGGAAGDDEDVVVVAASSKSRSSDKHGGGGDSSSTGGAKDGVEVFSILDAPTAERKPVTIGSGRQNKSATPAEQKKKKQTASGSRGSGKGKGRRRTLASPGSTASASGDDGAGGEDIESGEESPTSGEDDAAAAAAVRSGPARRSSRSSAVSRVKYTQSSGSEEEEEEEEEGGEEEDDEEEFEP